MRYCPETIMPIFYDPFRGHRRWLALKHLSLPAECRVMVFDNEDDEQESLIEFNRQREKTASQIFNEARVLKKIYSKRAALRQNELAKTRPTIRPDLTASLPEGVGDKSKGEAREQLSDATETGVYLDKSVET